MRFLSVCSGLEGASLAVDALGWTAAGFAEIDPFASAILAERFGSSLPGEPLSGNAPPNFGDFTAIETAALGTVEILIGGTPCQAFSVAGKRLSLADARGNLTLAYVVLAHELARSNGLRNCLWENVPGVLNTPDNAFGCFLGALVGAGAAIVRPGGGGWPSSGMVSGPRARAAWRVLDAQYFGLAQRRERVFVVGDFGNGADPAAVLFERAGLRGNSPPSRKAREGVAGTLSARTQGGGGLGTDFEIGGGLAPIGFGGGNRSGPIDAAACLTAKGQRIDFEVETFVACAVADSLTVGANQTTGFVGDVVAHSLRGEGLDASEDETGRGTPLGPIAFNWQGGGTQTGLGFDPESGITSTLQAEQTPAIVQTVAFDMRGREGGAMPEGPHDTANIRAASGGSSRSYLAFQTRGSNLDIGEIPGTIGSNADRASGSAPMLATRWAVRRLTPTECERLQGIPDGHTRIPWRGKPAGACPDGPRYKAIGNSWAVPVVKWIATRLDAALAECPS